MCNINKIKKEFILTIITLGIFSFTNVYADDIIYNKQILNNEPYVVGTSQTPTFDGGYAVTGYDLDTNAGRMLLIKYDSDGNKEWQTELDVDAPPFSDNCSAEELLSYNSNDEYYCHQSDGGMMTAFNSPGLVQMDDGKYMMFGTNGKGAVVSASGNVQNYFSTEIFDGTGKIKCYADGNRAICSQLFIENQNSAVVSFNEDGTILNQYKFSDYDAGGSIVSFFKDNRGYYMAEVLEKKDGNSSDEMENYMYVFDNNASFVSKSNENIFKGNYMGKINNSMDIDGYWIIGQLKDGAYIGFSIKYMEDIHRLKLSYVRIDENLQKVEKERVVVNSILVNEEIYIRYLANFYIAMFGGALVDENVLVLELGYSLNSSYITIAENLVTLDRDLNYLSYNKVGELELNLLGIQRNPMAFEFSGLAALVMTSVSKLEEGNDLVLMPTDTNTIRGQHIKLKGYYTTTGNDDAYFSRGAYKVGDKVLVNVLPKSGYHVEDVVIVDSTGKQIEYRKEDGSFIMPNRNVEVKEVYYGAGEESTNGSSSDGNNSNVFRNPKTATPIAIVFCLMSIGAGIYGLQQYQKKKM